MAEVGKGVAVSGSSPVTRKCVLTVNYSCTRYVASSKSKPRREHTAVPRAGAVVPAVELVDFVYHWQDLASCYW